MPNRTLDLIHRFLRQNNGTLSKRARTQEFALLTDEEVRAIERAYAAAFAKVSDEGAITEDLSDETG
jgi:ABC-type uncharacterized transport system auxiliary subunit